MKPTPDDANDIPGDAEADAQPWRSEDLERIHEEILHRKRPLPPSDSKADSVDRTDLSAARRVMGMIDSVRRRQQSSSGIRPTTTGSSAKNETPGLQFDGTPGRRNEPRNDAADRTESSTDKQFASVSMHRIGRFEIRRELGRGGCGIVFLADDPQLGRPVALKIPRPESLASDEGQRRFLREARAAALLAHPNIVTVYEASQAGVVCYLAAEWIDGPTLAQWIEAQPQPVDIRGAARLVAVLADAIQHAHARNVIHRDLKPANVLLDQSKSEVAGDLQTLNELAVNARVSDFGMARIHGDSRLTKSGDLVGTPAYIAPELINASSDVASPATDIYGLGTILYELLTGKAPFSGPTLAATLRAVELNDPVSPRRLRPEVPKDLDAICLKCLEKQPAQRYASAFELAKDLESWLQGRPVRVRHQTLMERSVRWVTRNRAVSAAMATVFLSITIGLVVSSSQWFRAERALKEVRSERDRAERHLGRAESAIDSMLDDVEQTLEPGTAAQGFRRHLLTAALSMQQELVDEQSGDARMPLRTAATLKRTAGINVQIGDVATALDEYHRIIKLLEGESIPEGDRAEAAALCNGIRVLMAGLWNSRKEYKQTESMLTKSLSQLKPQTPDESIDDSVLRAQMHYKLAVAQRGLRQNDDGRKSLSAALEAVRRFPHDADHLAVIRVLVDVHNSLGAADVTAGKPSIPAFEESARLGRLYLTFDPNDHEVRSMVVRAQENQATMTADNPGQAVALYREACDESRRLVADVPMNHRFNTMLLRGLNKLAVACRRIKQNDEAQRCLEEAAALGTTIEQKFGDSPDSIETQCLVKFNLASLTLEMTGDRARAEAELRDSVSFAQRLVEKYPYASAHHGLLFDKAGELAEYLLQLKRYDEARNFGLLTISEGRSLHAEFVASGLYTKKLADEYYRLAAICVRSHRHDEAINAADAIAALAPDRPDLSVLAARLMSRCSTVTAAAWKADSDSPEPRLLEQEQATQAILERYELLAVNHLRRAIDLGYTDAVSLKGDSTFEAIHDRTEFQELASTGRLVDSIKRNTGESVASLEATCRLQFNLAEALRKGGQDPQAADVAYRESVAAGKKLVALEPSVPEHHALLADKAGRFGGGALMYAQQLDEAWQLTILARTHAEQALAMRPGDGGFRQNLVDQLYRVAAVAVRMSRHEEAIQAAKSLSEVAPSDAGRFVTAAKLMARCSTIAEANPDAESSLPDQDPSDQQDVLRIVTERYENLAVSYLSRAVELGYTDLNSLTSNSQFESIHDHPDFKLLLSAGK